MLYVINCIAVYAYLSSKIRIYLGFDCNAVFTVLAHGMGRMFHFILEFIITCTEGKTAVLTLSPFSRQVQTSPSMEGNSITAVSHN